MTTFDEIKKRVLADTESSLELKTLLNSISTHRDPDECWQVQSKIGDGPWLPMTAGFVSHGVAKARSDYWSEIMPERCFRVECVRHRIDISVPKEEKIQQAITLAVKYGGIEGDHHKAWVIDQMVRALTGCPMILKDAIDCNGIPYTFEDMGESQEYLEVVRDARKGEDGPQTYNWEVGIAP